jgi:hypothetical protein
VIAPLRRRHRLLITLAAIASPLILYVALSGRSPVITDATPLVTRNIPPAGTVLVGEHSLQLPQSERGASIQAVLFRESDADAPWTLALADAGTKSPGPDVLVYWQQDDSLSQLTADAVLLGPYLSRRDNRYRMPVSRASGGVVLYSLAHNKVLGTLALKAMVEES